MKKLEKVISIRVDKDTHKKIKKLADKDNRSVNNFLITIIKEFIDKQNNAND